MPKGATPGRGKPREERRFDQTYLSERLHGQMIHRDYAAHYFRWGFAFRFCAGKRVLDVGCGPEWQLGKVLLHHGRIPLRPEFYVGVDLSPLKGDVTKHRALVGECDFTDPAARAQCVAPYGPFGVACCFEVVEHMEVDDAGELFRGVRQELVDDGVFLLSTPVLTGRGPARNHLHEFTVEELLELLHRTGWRIERRFGTYGDVPSIRKAMKNTPPPAPGEAHHAEAHLQTMEDLSVYYSNEVLATFLAPLYPDACKNNLWLLRKD